MKVGDLVRVTHPVSDFGDSELVMDSWYDGTPLLVLKESKIKYPDGTEGKTVLVQHGERTTWLPKNNLEV